MLCAMEANTTPRKLLGEARCLSVNASYPRSISAVNNACRARCWVHAPLSGGRHVLELATSVYLLIRD